MVGILRLWGGSADARAVMSAHSQNLKFTSELLTRPAISPGDVETSLEHFAIVSYAVAPERVRPHVHPSFDLDCFVGPDGKPFVGVSMVPFEDQDFRFAALPWLKFRFAQTNYRTYVIDRSRRPSPVMAKAPHR